MALLEFLLAKIILDESRKNWKVIGYFNDQKASENTVEISLKKKDLVKIWMYESWCRERFSTPQTPPNRTYLNMINECRLKLASKPLKRDNVAPEDRKRLPSEKKLIDEAEASEKLGDEDEQLYDDESENHQHGGTNKAIYCANTPHLMMISKKRLKDENRKTDEKEIGEKRPMTETPPPRKPKNFRG
ncbi:hypothetical protein GLOIN_2v1780646 [Rhizophagus irregularis DAOM 181602=DAOM 197198]|uniref:Uncharacterized protein n=1 Tax=Rhizophagus irregularis (strain DAOM 181602 / DAOM 197198 / MUCL 43194) TaxID=747089 RepID=A0A2P4PLZ5_RHIID|nr:hypothetical protein GLOIN_2v1780646 [Rhizophagus irregularis DAOM 181602=DAOM 197198]POG66387.1 hypothetical protein GLOIN_2v1780646 [Rhizophagus irregularis DAOM 181602=DAOM 197198]|eukprot:XP_025173253.1 hypothetical protein GLOIN_2v1780646 [Rhizophagus irregularis DAOM 181602=DAOM 197198]